MMFGKFWVGVMAAAVTGLLALPAPSAHAQPAQPAAPAANKPAAKKPAANKPAANKPMSDKKMSDSMPMHHHTMSCYDYAWESQQLKDCLAKKESKPMAHKASSKKPAAKKTP